jgi:hypothetical protein
MVKLVVLVGVKDPVLARSSFDHPTITSPSPPTPPVTRVSNLVFELFIEVRKENTVYFDAVNKCLASVRTAGAPHAQSAKQT